MLTACIICTTTAQAKQTDKEILTARIQAIISSSGAKVGVGLMGVDFPDTLLFSGTGHFPMQSVYKFPLALAILDRVDKGTLRLNQPIHIPKAELDTNTWSPMVEEHPGQDIDLTLADLLRYTVSKSDNNGCDILFRMIGGPKVAQEYIRNTIGVKGIAMAATEAQMHRKPKTMYTNWCEPLAMLHILQLFDQGKVLSLSGTTFLRDCMINSQNSPTRIKALLPENVTVAHKTGTSGTDKRGYNGATNDVGIITLPGGGHLAIVVYVSDYKGDVQKGESVIAEIAKLAWDYYSAQH
jgi:beta-lactamase class A